MAFGNITNQVKRVAIPSRRLDVHRPLSLRCGGVFGAAKEVGNKQNTQDSIPRRTVSYTAENPPATKYYLALVVKR